MLQASSRLVTVVPLASAQRLSGLGCSDRVPVFFARHGSEEAAVVNGSDAPQHRAEQGEVDQHNHAGADPARGLQQERCFQIAHQAPAAAEPHQRDHREGQLQRKHHLAQHQQIRGGSLAEQDHRGHRRDQGEAAGEQPPLPVGQSDLQEPLHHDLAGHGGGERRALSRRQQGHPEQHAGERGAQHRRQQPVGLAQVRHRLR